MKQQNLFILSFWEKEAISSTQRRKDAEVRGVFSGLRSARLSGGLANFPRHPDGANLPLTLSS